MNTEPTVDSLMAAAFNCVRDVRSVEYRTGVRALLSQRIHGHPLACAYKMGSPQADAFYAGVDEGRTIWRDVQIAAAKACA